MEKRFKLLRARLLVPLSEEIGFETRYQDGYVLIEGDRIREVGKYYEGIGERIIEECGRELQVVGAKKERDYREKDIPCIDGVLLPGFVKAHGHNHEPPIIGLAKDQPLTSWLDHAVNLFTGFLTEEAEGLAKTFGKSANLVTFNKALLDDVYYGITSAMNHQCNFSKYHVRDMVLAADAVGTKLTVAVGSQDRNYDPRILDTPETAVRRLDEYLEFLGDRPRVRVCPGPDQAFSNSAEMVRAQKEWADAHDTIFHMHSSEEPNTTRWFYSQYLASPVQYLHEAGVLDPNTILAHQVNCTPVDLEILAGTGTKVVHNPLANTILGSGMPPVIEMMAKGIPVVISTDGSGSADNQNILSAAKLASQYQKALNQNARLLPAQQVLEMITVLPARFLGINAGSLEPGRDADVVLVDLDRPNLTPTRVDNVVENLIWAADGSEVRWVIANGRLLKDDYRFVVQDEEKIKAEVMLLSRLLMEYAGTRPEIKATGVRGAGEEA
ncbi:MAG TPA: amidohydrolase family protein [bacterium]|nr:amidohydrolase family protein [bacterium]HPQ65361.1 amidohydrolase family protein [bacterium]